MAGKTCHLFGRSLKRCLSSQHVRGSLLTTNQGRVPSLSYRCLASQAGDHVIVDREDATGIAMVKLNRKPVNSLSLEVLTELHLALEKLEGDKSCRGVILTSANDGVFSSGLDIMEMYQPEEARLREFWRNLQEVFLHLYGSGLITIAAINGHAPAGGCLLAICSDYRVMAAPKFTIGLNETQLGIVAPFWFRDLFVSTVGQRQAEYCLQLGRLVTSEQALSMGLVDQLADIDKVTTMAKEEIVSWLKIPGLARQLTKSAMRAPLLQKLTSQRDEDINNFVSFITKDSVQKAIGAYIESLKKKKS